MLHEPAAKSGPDPASPYKTRLGVIMFIIYALIYLGFMGINIVKPELMKKIVFAGLNLSIVYGFCLIIIALFMAVLYNHMCTSKEKALKENVSVDGGVE